MVFDITDHSFPRNDEVGCDCDGGAVRGASALCRSNLYDTYLLLEYKLLSLVIPHLNLRQFPGGGGWVSSRD